MSIAALAVVIARAGSRGLPGKNHRTLRGRPMVQHTLEDALDAATIGRVVLSTDCPHVAAAARAMGTEVIDRPRELATDDATVDAAVRHAVTASASGADVVVILYANVPVRPAGLIDRAVRELVATRADSVQSYAPVGKHHPWWMVRLDDDGRVDPLEPNAVYRRQDLPPLLLPDGGVIAVRRAALFTEIAGRPHAFLGADRRGIRTAAGEVVDVDDEVDALVAESILATRHDCGAAP